MRLYEVQKALEGGQRIRRMSWGNLHICMYEGVIIEGEILSDFYVNKFKMYEFSQNDILADDWEIVEDIPEVIACPSIRYRFRCPVCERWTTEIDNSDYNQKCVHCGLKVKMKPYSEPQNTDLLLGEIVSFLLSWGFESHISYHNGESRISFTCFGADAFKDVYKNTIRDIAGNRLISFEYFGNTLNIRLKPFQTMHKTGDQ